MSKKHVCLAVVITLFPCIFFFASCGTREETPATVSEGGSYQKLLALYREWREFQKPDIQDSVPDYTAAAMEKQHIELKTLQDRLAAFNIEGWPVSHQVDYHLVRAEMNGLDFDHRVLRPWSRNPCFYAVYYSSPSDVPALEGPWKYGTLCLWKYDFPLSEEDLVQFQLEIRAVPKMLEQAKINLVEEAKDLWFLGIRLKQKESTFLGNLAQRLAEQHPELVADVESAKAAVEVFQAWLAEKQKTMKAPSGIGIENYNWYMKNVHLIPYTWEEQVTIIERELARAFSSLKLEEHRNRKLPKLEPPQSREEYQLRFDETVEYFMNFLKNDEIMTVPDYLMDTLKRTVGFSPLDGMQDFFNQVDYRDQFPLRCHGTHWFDLARMKLEPHLSPVRSTPLLYNIWDSRAEGLATGFEEMMMHAGLLGHKSSRVRELVYIMLANRCARAMGDLKMHSLEFDIQDAMKFAVEKTPYGWLLADGNTVWFDEQLYLEQPGYGTSYVVGKVYLEKLIADYALVAGSSFNLKQFMDEFHSCGMIPLSLIHWEMTGLDDEVKKLMLD